MTSALVYTSDAEHDAARAAQRDAERAHRLAVIDAHQAECDCKLDASQCDLGLG